MPHKDKDIRKKYLIQYREKNRDRIRKHAKEFREIHKEEIKVVLKKYYEDNKEKIKKKVQDWNTNNKDVKKETNRIYHMKNKTDRNKRQREYCKGKGKNIVRNSKYKKTFGITLEEYNEMFTKQNGCCSICGRHQSEFNKALSVDHNHETGEIRGLLCSKCNFGIGNFNDSIELIEKALLYLKTN